MILAIIITITFPIYTTRTPQCHRTSIVFSFIDSKITARKQEFTSEEIMQAAGYKVKALENVFS